MKKLLPIIFILILSSCSKEVPLEVLPEQLVVRNETSYLVNSMEPFTGIAASYHKNGQLEQKTNYKNGKKDGILETYYKNGQLQYKTNFKDGKEDGLSERYDENGQLILRRNYKDGKREDGL